METKWIIAGGVGVAAVIGAIVYFATSGSSLDADKALKLQLNLDSKKYYDKGFAEGTAQGSTDRGKTHNPSPTLNEAENDLPKEASWAVISKLSAANQKDYVQRVQDSYENGVNDGYERQWVGPTPVVVAPMSVPATPKPGGAKPGQSAYDYGYSRGKSTGYKDGTAGDTSGPDSYLASDGSKQRQNESGNPTEYIRGYKDGYYYGFAAAETDKAIAAVSITGESSSEPLLAVAGILSVGADVRPGHLLSIGYSPRSGGTLLSVAGARVIGIRAPVVPSIVGAMALPRPVAQASAVEIRRRGRLGMPVPMPPVEQGMSPHPMWPTV